FYQHAGAYRVLQVPEVPMCVPLMWAWGAYGNPRGGWSRTGYICASCDWGAFRGLPRIASGPAPEAGREEQEQGVELQPACDHEQAQKPLEGRRQPPVGPAGPQGSQPQADVPQGGRRGLQGGQGVKTGQGQDRGRSGEDQKVEEDEGRRPPDGLFT